MEDVSLPILRLVARTEVDKDSVVAPPVDDMPPQRTFQHMRETLDGSAMEQLARKNDQHGNNERFEPFARFLDPLSLGDAGPSRATIVTRPGDQNSPTPGEGVSTSCVALRRYEVE